MLSLILCQTRRADGCVACENDLNYVAAIDLTNEESKNIILGHCCTRHIAEGDGIPPHPDNLYEETFYPTCLVPNDIQRFKYMIMRKSLMPDVDMSEILYLRALIAFLEYSISIPNGVICVG